MKILLAFTVALCICSVHTSQGDIGYLLPGDLVPEFYDLQWTFTDNCTQLVQFQPNYTGLVHIHMTAVKKKVTVIQLNYVRSEINTAVLTIPKSSKTYKLDKPTYYDNYQKITLISPVELPINEIVILTLTFASTIDRLSGLYLVSHRYESNLLRGEGTEMSVQEQKESIFTHFEPALARSAYPCFDEPKYKAHFKVSVDVSTCATQRGYHVLSNTEREKKVVKNDRTIIHFRKTEYEMSTYLLSFVITPFKHTPSNKFNSSYPDLGVTEMKKLTTWSVDHMVKSETVTAAQEVGVRLMEILSNTFKIGYPLRKLDQVAIFLNEGGMENWGIINYGFPGQAGISLLDLLAHEMSHQWVGNLVTCHWWSDIWLNEGFATYFAAYSVDQFVSENPGKYPYEPWTHFVATTLIVGLNSDTSKGHPLSSPVENPSDYMGLFDEITYKKGSSVIRMWSHVLGEDAFLKSMQKYISDRKFNIATPKHLFHAYDTFVNESVSDFDGGLPSEYFTSWIIQNCFPLVEVKKNKSNPLEYVITQRDFCAKGKPSSKWTLPISYATDIDRDFNKTHAMLWFKQDDEKVTVTLSKPVRWIIVNNRFTGFYRVNYNMENWEYIVQELLNVETYDLIHPANRIQIVNDLFTLASKSASVDYAFALDASLYLKHEMHPDPWKAALDHSFDFLNTMLAKTASYPFFKAYIRDLLQSHYERLSFGDRVYDGQIRVDVMKWVCKMDDPTCIADSRHFLNGSSERSSLYHSLREIAYCVETRQNYTDWETLWGRYTSASDYRKMALELQGMACSRNEETLKRLIMKTIDKSAIMTRGQRNFLIFAILNADPLNVGIVLDFLIENYEPVDEMYDGRRPVDKLLLTIAGKLATDEELVKLRNLTGILARNKKIRVATQTISKALEMSMENNRWFNKKLRDVTSWLVNHYNVNGGDDCQGCVKAE